jgi:hypothetical protein
MSTPPRKPHTRAASATAATSTGKTTPADAAPTRLQEVPPPAKQDPPKRQQGQQDPANETAELHADIDRTREQLSQTVEALAHKADLPGQAKAKAWEVTETVQGKAEEVTHQVADTVARGADAVQAKADEVGAHAKSLLDQSLAALPPTVRDRVERAVAVARQRPVPTAIVAVLVVLVLRRLLRRTSTGSGS